MGGCCGKRTYGLEMQGCCDDIDAEDRVEHDQNSLPEKRGANSESQRVSTVRQIVSSNSASSRSSGRRSSSGRSFRERVSRRKSDLTLPLAEGHAPEIDCLDQDFVCHKYDFIPHKYDFSGRCKRSFDPSSHSTTTETNTSLRTVQRRKSTLELACERSNDQIRNGDFNMNGRRRRQQYKNTRHNAVMRMSEVSAQE
eukprot:SAG31_NODE_183_length_20987_cov_8.711078_14_plen_197_part_00